MNDIDRIKDLKKYIIFANKQGNFSNDADYKWHKELADMIENLIKEYKELKEKISKYEKQLDLDYVEENYIPKSKLKNVKNYIENKMDIVDNPTICGDEEDTITELPISLCLYNEDLRKLLELLED